METRNVLGALVLCAVSVQTQQQSATTPIPPEPVLLPAGVWESVQADGSTVGIYVRPVSGDDVPKEQMEGDDGVVLAVGVFQKRHQQIDCGEQNFFAIGEKDPSHDAVTSYAHGKLEIHYHVHVTGSEIQLKLILDPSRNVWTGHFQRDVHARPFPDQSFDGQVVLHRVPREQGGCPSGGSKT